MSRSAIARHWSRSGSMPIVIQCVGVSARGYASAWPLCSTSSKVPCSAVSMAVVQTSPSPCAPWPSPHENSAPGTSTGRYSDVPGAQFLVVEVAAMGARLDRADAAPVRWRRHAHHAEERMQRQVQAPGQPGHHAFGVERDVQVPVAVELVGQRAGQRPDHVVAPVLPQLHVDDAHLQHVAGHRHPSTATGPVRMWPGASIGLRAWMSSSSGGT